MIKKVVIFRNSDALLSRFEKRVAVLAKVNWCAWCRESRCLLRFRVFAKTGCYDLLSGLIAHNRKRSQQTVGITASTFFKWDGLRVYGDGVK